MSESGPIGARIRERFFCEAIDGRRYLIDRENGEISLLNESAGLILDLLSHEESINQAAAVLAEHANLTVEHARRDVVSVINGLGLESAERDKGDHLYFEPADQDPGTSASVVRYRLNAHVFLVRYPTKSLLELNHVMLADMEVVDDPHDIQTTVEIGVSGRGFQIFVDGEFFASAPGEKDVQGFLRGIMIRTAYPCAAALVMLHAACVSHAGKAVILAGPSGAGKSTLALHLSRHGWAYHGDDTIGVDLARNRILPFPTRFSVKDGAWSLFAGELPELAGLPVFRTKAKPAKAVAAGSDVEAGSPKVAAIVFVNYVKETPAELVPLGMSETLDCLNAAGAVFHPEDMEVSPRKLLLWLDDVSAYGMVHSDLTLAETKLRALAAGVGTPAGSDN